MPATKPDTIDQLYGLIANEEDARVCKDIPEEACREVPRNFFLILFSNVLTRLGDLLISPKTVLAWLMSAVGAPAPRHAGEAVLLVDGLAVGFSRQTADVVPLS